ncbi:unnamed protein product, partial [Cylicocyclus nassatus]
MWLYLVTTATVAALCLIVNCGKKKKPAQSAERIPRKESKETMEKLTAESDKKSVEPNVLQHQVAVAPPQVAHAPAPPHPPPPPLPPAAQPTRPAPPQPVPLP